MKNLLISILFALILGATAFYFFSFKESSPPDPYIASPSEISPLPAALPSSNPVSDLGAGGSSYLNPEGLYSFLYPNDYKMDEQNQGKQVRIYKNGPTQKGQTEMYDGVIMVFEAVSLSDKNLSSWVDDYIKTATADGTSQIIEAKKAFSVKNYPGYSFKTRGLGEAQYYVLQKDAASKNALMITTLVQDPENVGFQKEVEDTLSTLQLLR